MSPALITIKKSIDTIESGINSFDEKYRRNISRIIWNRLSTKLGQDPPTSESIVQLAQEYLDKEKAGEEALAKLTKEEQRLIKEFL